MKILYAISEIAPWAKTGGLGDVGAALPAALAGAGVDVRVLCPAWPALKAAFPDAPMLASLPALAPGLPPARLLGATAAGLELLLLDCPEFFSRPGHPYLAGDGSDWPDNALRFGLLSRAAATLGQPWSPLAWRPDIVHLNDWQTALGAAYLHYEGGAASVVTIHNLAFQGCFGRELLHALRLPDHAWRFDGVEFHGHLCFLKAGLQFADRITTVSPTYAREIAGADFGYGLAPLLRHRREALTGFLNGIDTAVWNPANDPLLAARYSATALAGKRACKAKLLAETGLSSATEEPLLAVVSRLTGQKGLDLLLALGDRLAELPARLVVLGSGEAALEAGFSALAARHPGRIAVRLGYDEALAHRIEAGADIFLMPSRFEPCGLNQLYSLAYGTPPVVRSTGGLADTVVDCTPASLADGSGNGFVFEEATPEALWLAIQRAVSLWHRPPEWQRLQQNGMACDHSWRRAATPYLDLYRELKP